MSRRGEGSKGLQHLSKIVLDKVRHKQKTTYNELAEEMVGELCAPGSGMSRDYDGKNIRRRVYDILNVLIAMNIVTKERKELRWKGLPPSGAAEVAMLEREQTQLQRRCDAKERLLRDLLLQKIAMENLIHRNKTRARPVPDDAKIRLPFVIIKTGVDTVIEADMADDRTDVAFNFSDAFEIHDDNEILKRMGMQRVQPGCDLARLARRKVPRNTRFTQQRKRRVATATAWMLTVASCFD